jgi:hypothetical protein
MKHYGVTSWSSINKAKLIYEMIQEQYAGKKIAKVMSTSKLLNGPW